MSTVNPDAVGTTAASRGAAARRFWTAIAVLILGGLLVATFLAPENLSAPMGTMKERMAVSYQTPMSIPPFGTDGLGIPLTEYAMQGASIVTIPAVLSGFLVMALAIMSGLSRCAGIGWTDTALQGFTELVGALPRLVVVLVVALAVPRELRSLLPIGLTWAILAAPGAMDEAAATAERLGGARFVEALRAHGFSAWRIYVYHITWLNLRSVIVRQGAEVAMQVVFLEIALSYLAASDNEPSFTHSESMHSWASLLYDGYTALVAQVPMYHALGLGLVLVAVVAFMAQAMRLAARAR